MHCNPCFCDNGPTCDNLNLSGCHTLNHCIQTHCDNVTCKTAHSHVCARARTGTFLYTSACHSVTTKIKSITYGVTTLAKRVGPVCHAVTTAILRVCGQGIAMEWTRKSAYSFGSAEGYQVCKAAGVRKGTQIWLYTAWSPKDVRVAGYSHRYPRNLGTRRSVGEAVALCKADLNSISKSEVAA